MGHPSTGKVPNRLPSVSSLKTVFVEPESFITDNNELTLAEAQVTVEERRVLEERSGWIAQEGDVLLQGVARGVVLDLLQARARLGARLDGVICDIGERGEMALRAARNPLLALRGVPVVANDTGPGHILAAADKPMVCICGPTDPVRVKPICSKVETLQAEVECRNCYLKECPNRHICMEEVTADMVIESLRGLQVVG